MRSAVTLVLIAVFAAAQAGESGTKPRAFRPNPKLAAMPDESAILLTNGYRKGRGVMDYSGMVYDHHRHKILTFGGGHAAPGFPNSVHEFDFGTLRWTQLTENVPQKHHVKANAVLDKDGKPLCGVKYKGKIWAVSRHTYDGLAMAAKDDVMICVQAVTSSGYSYTPKKDWPWFWGSAIWIFDPVKREWSVIKKNGLALNHTGSAVWPKKPDWVYFYSQRPLFRAVNWKTGELRKLARPPRGGLAHSYAGLQYYPEEEALVAFPKGPKASGGKNKLIYKFDLKTEKWTTKEVQGDAPKTYDLNAVYDSRNKVFVVYDNKEAFHYYSPRENRWYKTKKVIDGVKGIRHHHVYDPVDNVHIVLGSRWKTAAFKLSDKPGKLPGTGSG